MIAATTALALSGPSFSEQEAKTIEDHIDNVIRRGPTSTTQTSNRPEVLHFTVHTTRSGWSRAAIDSVLAMYARSGWSVAPGVAHGILATLSVERS